MRHVFLRFYLGFYVFYVTPKRVILVPVLRLPVIL